MKVKTPPALLLPGVIGVLLLSAQACKESSKIVLDAQADRSAPSHDGVGGEGLGETGGSGGISGAAEAGGQIAPTADAAITGQDGHGEATKAGDTGGQVALADAPSDSPVGDTAALPDAGHAGAIVDGGGVRGEACFNSDGSITPAAKACASAADCVQFTIVGCCTTGGVRTVIGLARSARCVFPVPGCIGRDCGPSSFLAEDGNSVSRSDDVQLVCSSGRCSTVAAGDAGSAGGDRSLVAD
jgi:hypothetical protein